jgi:adenine-specific DNA-methyltransferase
LRSAVAVNSPPSEGANALCAFAGGGVPYRRLLKKKEKYMPTLNWLDKKTAVKTAAQTPYKLLKFNADLSYGDESENMIIKGDNLEALKALLPYYKGRVKCIYIDPPFNTGSAFEHYDDNVEHSTWLSLMYPRLELLRDLLSEKGIVCVHLDDEEVAYMKIVMDEIFGRSNYLNMITMTTNEPSGFKATSSSLFSTANYILMYSKNRALSKINKVFMEKEYDNAYSKVLINKKAPYQEWTYENISDVVARKNNFLSALDAKKKLGINEFNNKIAQYAIANADNVFRTAAIGGGAKLKRIETIEKSKNNKNCVFLHPNEDVEGFYILNGEQIIFYSARISVIDGENKPVQAITDVWTDISWTGIAREGEVEFKNGKKPEKLIQRVFEMTTNPNDLILDSFLGSGTTAAVAHKMNRRYIGIEMGEQAITHIVPRLKKVIDGSDEGGISKTVGWKGGGGFSFYDLGISLFDHMGAINKEVDFNSLAFHVWFSHTKTPMDALKKASVKKSPLIGIFNNSAIYLLYNGILEDKSIEGGNILSLMTLNKLPKYDGIKIVYAFANALGSETLRRENIIFKQIPYVLKRG